MVYCYNFVYLMYVTHDFAKPYLKETLYSWILKNADLFLMCHSSHVQFALEIE